MASVKHLEGLGTIHYDGRTYGVRKMKLEYSEDFNHAYIIHSEDKLPGALLPDAFRSTTHIPKAGDVMVSYGINTLSVVHDCYIFDGTHWMDGFKFPKGMNRIHPVQKEYHLDLRTKGYLRWKLIDRPDQEFKNSIPDPPDVGTQSLWDIERSKPEGSDGAPKLLNPRLRYVVTILIPLLYLSRSLFQQQASSFDQSSGDASQTSTVRI